MDFFPKEDLSALYAQRARTYSELQEMNERIRRTEDKQAAEFRKARDEWLARNPEGNSHE